LAVAERIFGRTGRRGVPPITFLQGECGLDIKKYIDEKAKGIIPAVYMGYNNAVVFAEQHVRPLADGL